MSGFGVDGAAGAEERDGARVGVGVVGPVVVAVWGVGPGWVGGGREGEDVDGVAEFGGEGEEG